MTGPDKSPRSLYSVQTLSLGLLLAMVALLIGTTRERRNAGDRQLGSSGFDRAGGQLERCLLCHHADLDSPGGSHSAAAVGCSSCHLGNRFAFTAQRAHTAMEPNPGALASVWRTCGRSGCHNREATRVLDSLMATARGIVAVDRWAFGELPQPIGDETMQQLLAETAPSPAQAHLGKLCGGCHLHATPDNRDDAITTTGSGCAACHLRASSIAGQHATVDSRVGDERCLGCHSRSGRIALSYAGLAELEPGQHSECAEPATLHDGRPGCRVTADVHHERGLGCIDCHLHTELMGDGAGHQRKQDQVEVTCQSCHAPRADDERRWDTVDDPITAVLLQRAAQTRPGAEPVRTGHRGTPLWNLRPAPDSDGWRLQSKLTGAQHEVPLTPTDANHQVVGHERLTCASCHAVWAPTCTSCHTEYDPAGRQWSFAAAAPTSGAWTERSDGFGWGPPTLAVTGDDTIVPAVPGMVMTLKAGTGPPIQQRLYAQLDPHTTTRQGRSCDSCHRSSVALGLGAGLLDLTAEPATFTPSEPASDGSAGDRWTTLGADEPGRGTRRSLRSLNADEQQRVLEVGRCTPCHARADDPIYRDLAGASRRMNERCTEATATIGP